MTTPLRPGDWSNVIHVDGVFFCFVFDVALQLAEHPLLVLRGARDTLPAMLQILEQIPCSRSPQLLSRVLFTLGGDSRRSTERTVTQCS